MKGMRAAQPQGLPREYASAQAGRRIGARGYGHAPGCCLLTPSKLLCRTAQPLCGCPEVRSTEHDISTC